MIAGKEECMEIEGLDRKKHLNLYLKENSALLSDFNFFFFF